MTLRLTPQGMERLQGQMANMEACIRCGLCLSVCPTYKETLREEEGPRGRIAQAKAVAEGAIPLTLDVVRHEENCLVCEACTAVCPSGFHMEPLQLALRESMREVQPMRRRLLSQALAPLKHPALLRFLTGTARMARRTGALALMKLVGLGRLARMAPPLQGDAFVPQGQQWPAQSANGASGEGHQAVLFSGCVMSTVFPHIHEAEVEVLTGRGMTVTAPASQGCCGALQAHAGLVDEARAMARRNIAGLESAPGVIAVDSAGCAAFLKTYGELLRDDPAYAERAHALATRVREALELAASRPAPAMGPVEIGPVTYQEACHLAHAQRIKQQPRQLLKQVPGLQFVEMAESDVCCGSGGVYNIIHFEMGNSLGRRKAANIKATGAPVVLTSNPGCHLQLQAHLQGEGVRVMHVLEVLAMSQRAGAKAALDAAPIGVAGAEGSHTDPVQK
jgi:glycolate oxidase iron-sulfur subunit